jgi:septal ring factor EnvC (AmiA/AmiB activator)
MTDKIKSIDEQIQELAFEISQFAADISRFEQEEANEKAEEFLKRCKQRGLISTFVGDKDYKTESS